MIILTFCYQIHIFNTVNTQNVVDKLGLKENNSKLQQPIVFIL